MMAQGLQPLRAAGINASSPTAPGAGPTRRSLLFANPPGTAPWGQAIDGVIPSAIRHLRAVRLLRPNRRHDCHEIDRKVLLVRTPVG